MSVFVIERMAIIHSLKCIVPFSFVIPLLPLALTHYHLLSLVVTRCIARCHSLSFVVPLVVTRCHSLSLVLPLFFTGCHSLSLVVPLVVPLVVIRCQSLYHSLSLDVPLICLFINDRIMTPNFYKLFTRIKRNSNSSQSFIFVSSWSNLVFPPDVFCCPTLH